MLTTFETFGIRSLANENSREKRKWKGSFDHYPPTHPYGLTRFAGVGVGLFLDPEGKKWLKVNPGRVVKFFSSESS